MTSDRPQDLSPPTPELLQRFCGLIGKTHVLVNEHDIAPYMREWRGRYVGRAAAVLRPGTAEEVAAILALANEAHVGVVPQGGNTGLVAGQIPHEYGGEVVISLSRLRQIRSLDESSNVIVAEAGLTVGEIQQIARDRGRLFPLSLASEGSCQVGGVLSTNAGGVNVLAYGSARALALGLEVALPDGRIWNGLRTLHKDNTGYDLRDLFIGSEGTLGIITAAALKLFPERADKATAFVAVPDLDAMLRLFRRCGDAAGPELTAFEFMCAEVLGFALTHMDGLRHPLSSPSPWFALIEVAANGAGNRAQVRLERVLGDALAAGEISDAVVASSEAQGQELWRLREALSEAQKFEGGSIKHDISLPVASIGAFIARAGQTVEKICPGARPVPFGHFGDGNIHYNVTQPKGMDKTAYVSLWDTMSGAVHEIVLAMGGSISAEHGIGRMKRADLLIAKSAVEMDLMRRIKQVFDPNGIMNPGKVL